MGFALNYTRKQLNEIQRQDASIATLSRMLEDIRKLEQQDSIQLLWGETCTDSEAEQKRRRIEVSLRDYDTRVSTTQHRIRTEYACLDVFLHGPALTGIQRVCITCLPK